jgi:hypothetical protein
MATTDSTPLASPSGLTIVSVVVPVMETSSIDALDAAHTNSLKFLGMARSLGGSGVITGMKIVVAADVATGLWLHLFTAETTQTADAAFAPSAAQSLTYVDTIETTTWYGSATARFTHNRNVRTEYQCAAADSALYGVIQIPTGITPTYGAADVVTVALRAYRYS